MLISASSWSSGLCPMAIFFSRIRCLSLRSVSTKVLPGPLEFCSRKIPLKWCRSRVAQENMDRPSSM